MKNHSSGRHLEAATVSIHLKKKNYLSLQYVLSVDPKVFPTPLPDPFGDVPCASHVRLKSNYLCAGLVSEMPYSF